MTPERIAELRAAGVLDGTRADAARIVLLDLYETARGHNHELAPPSEGARGLSFLVWFLLDPLMADTPHGRALRWARRRMRRRAS